MGHITVTLTGDEARLLRSLDRVIAKEREVGKAGKEAATEHADGLKDVESKLMDVIKKTSELGVIGAVFAAATGAARELKEGIDGIAESLKNVKDQAAAQSRAEGQSFAKLGQLGPDSGAAITLAKRLKDQGGLSEADATQGIFGLRRAGLLNSGGADVAIEAARLGLGPDAVGRAAAVERGFGREVTAESVRKLLGQAVAASPGNTVETLDAMTREAPLAKQLGIGEQELLAAQAQLAQSSSSPEHAAKGMHQLLESFAKHRVKGGSFADMITGQQGRHGSEKGLLERFGPQGLEALRALNPGALRGAAGELGGANLDDNLGALRDDPGVALYMADRDATALEGRQREGAGRRSIGRNLRRTRERIGNRKAGMNEAEVLAEEARLDHSAGSFFGIPNAIAPDETHGNANDAEATAAAIGTLHSDLSRLLGDLNRHAAETAGNTRGHKTGVTPERDK